jgi:hypothetical protein
LGLLWQRRCNVRTHGSTDMTETVEAFDLLGPVLGPLTHTVTFNAGVTKTVAHGLGRKPTGYLVTRGGGILIEESLADGERPEELIALRSNTSGTFAVVVF